jgi:ABC-type transport system substrate-binding protein
MDWLVVRQRVTASQFEAALFVANSSLDSPMGVLPFFGEESFIGYTNRDVIVLLNELQSTIDPNEIDRIHRQLAPIFEADLPVTFLYPNIGTSVASRRVQGLSTPFRADPVRYMDELWIEEKK